MNAACPDCGLKFQCLCSAVPSFRAPFQLSLLTHDNEWQRETNTGRWLGETM
ncbi:DTW domain-containing protein, partial [Vibrio cholerae]|uniref:DTW domain-containing protein n=1 Tax=Vibrio cholerae TaxID=666 RepID=UPI002B4B9BF5